MHHVFVKNGNFALNLDSREPGRVIKKLKFIENEFFGWNGDSNRDRNLVKSEI